MGEMNRKQVQSGTWFNDGPHGSKEDCRGSGMSYEVKVQEIFKNLGEGVDLGIEEENCRILTIRVSGGRSHHAVYKVYCVPV